MTALVPAAAVSAPMRETGTAAGSSGDMGRSIVSSGTPQPPFIGTGAVLAAVASPSASTSGSDRVSLRFPISPSQSLTRFSCGSILAFPFMGDNRDLGDGDDFVAAAAAAASFANSSTTTTASGKETVAGAGLRL